MGIRETKDRTEERHWKMEKKYGIDMRLPEGKLPGYYAQIIKGIADRAPLFDRHKELLIFYDKAYFPAVLDFLQHYKVEAEICELLVLPQTGVARSGRFDDFAIETREGNVYLDLTYTAAFALTAARPEAEAAPALLQLEEHRIASVLEDGQTWHFIEKQLVELAERVARAYRCGIIWWDQKAE
jgi:hypothetical protein